MRIGVVASSGGSAFDSMRQILADAGQGSYEYFVATDRSCGIEALCRQNKIQHQRFEIADNGEFSRSAADWFESFGGVDIVLLYFLRLVTGEIYNRFATFNIHPSLLPAFRGFNPIERAFRQQVRFLGATAHLVNEKPDGGPLVAQVTMPVGPATSMDQFRKYSFIQKVYLSVLLVEMRRHGLFRRDSAGQIVVSPDLPITDRCNPRIECGELWKTLLQFQTEQGVEVLR